MSPTFCISKVALPCVKSWDRPHFHFPETSVTVNANFGTQPQGFHAEMGGAYGTGLLGRFSVGWAPSTGAYGSVGFGFGWARSFGAAPGYGGYIYEWSGE